MSNKRNNLLIVDLPLPQNSCLAEARTWSDPRVAQADNPAGGALVLRDACGQIIRIFPAGAWLGVRREDVNCESRPVEA